jgi:hypothetical protein
MTRNLLPGVPYNLMVIFVFQREHPVKLFCSRGYYLFLLSDTKPIKVFVAEAKLLVQVLGEESGGIHVVLCFLMIPV